nr:blue copper protein-like [Tanacetum cinerariifolium]
MRICSVGVVLLMLLACCMPSLAKVYTVGDSAGWSLSVDYSTWTSGKTFKVGDSLVFNYGSSHSVAEVSSNDYDTCSVANSIASYNNGPTTVALNTTGTHYFVCGVVGHCGGGMKVSVPVTADGGSGGASPTPSGTGSSSTTTPPKGSSTGSVPASSPTNSPFVAAVFVCKTRTFALGDKPHSFFAPEGKPPRRGLNPRPLACGNNLPKSNKKNKVIESAHTMLQDFSQANQATVVIMAPHNTTLRTWSAPTYGVIIINGDDVVSGNNGVAGLGFVVRSHSGSVLVAGSKRVNYVMLVFEGEANAILWAIQVV